jgi:micrococcal nuclease
MKIPVKTRILLFFLLSAVFILSSFYIKSQNPTETLKKLKEQYPYSEFGKVTRVIDGDTFKLQNGKTIRLIGVDTPELHHPKKPVQCFGKEAMEKTKELLLGKIIRLKKDHGNKDKYGRFLRFVYIVNLSPTPPPSHQLAELFLNQYLVAEGYGRLLMIPPNTTMKHFFTTLQTNAKLRKKGLWGKCGL